MNKIENTLIELVAKLSKRHRVKCNLLKDKHIRRMCSQISPIGKFIVYSRWELRDIESVGKHWKNYLIATILHELGHFYHNTTAYDSFNDKLEAEYLAETYALRILKTYYPTDYKYRVQSQRKNLRNSSWASEDYYLYYRKAWEKIKEYN